MSRPLVAVAAVLRDHAMRPGHVAALTGVSLWRLRWYRLLGYVVRVGPHLHLTPSGEQAARSAP